VRSGEWPSLTGTACRKERDACTWPRQVYQLFEEMKVLKILWE